MSIKINITVHESFSDCETCGSYTSTILSAMSHTHPDFGEIESGTGAACYDIVEANTHQFIDDIFFNLKKNGYDVPFPEWKSREINEELEARYEELVEECGTGSPEGYGSEYWDTYWEYDEYKNLEFESAYYDFYENAFEEDIPNSFVNYLKSHGIDVRVQFTYDEVYDASDWYNDDDVEEEE